ncbi:RagB/SusD family nutrient uptake outer membrane protein [Persicobacter psychrovividus]|uniref:Membrane protein n=1 Tax=Persicobacter psychrovividus TaxID=387638 RepID=A0ABM7VJ29_9BACT|nr:membrane protein [Persicobacter psychrovividus]
MKSLLRILLAATLSSGMVACDSFLTQMPISEVGADDYFRNDDEVETGVIGMYDGLQDVVQQEYAILEMRTDNAGTRSGVGDWAQFEVMNITPYNSIVANYWRTCYAAIYRANMIIAHIENVVDPGKKAQFEAEARFVRAYLHFNLVRLFGSVPKADYLIRVGDYEGYKQADTEALYQFIAEDLQFAADHLPTRANVALGRANQESAKTMLAKYLIQFKKFDEAKTLLKEVIDGGNFELNANYNDIFYQSLGNEIMFPISFVDDNTDNSQEFSYYFLFEQGSHNYATEEMVALYEAEPGENGTEDLRYTTNIIDMRGVRRGCGKFVSSSSNVRLAGNDYILLRYADVLLLYVEATMGNDFQTNDATALEYFNAIRSRAGLAPLANVSKPTLAKERRKEFLYENQRWFDMVRTGDLKMTMANYLQSNGLTYNENRLLLPIPQREIDTSNGHLVQNPGY